MWVQVRTMDGKKSEQVDGLSKLTKIEDFRELVMEKFGVECSLQRLFFRGKQMEDGHSLFDYNVGLNDIIQLLERRSMPTEVVPASKTDKHNIPSDTDSGIDTKENNTEMSKVGDEVLEEQNETYKNQGLYTINQLIDAKDEATGAWFEAKVQNVLNQSSESSSSSSVTYEVKFDDYDETRNLSEKLIRPRARKLLEWDEINVCDKLMVNYNLDCPNQRGFWYDCIVLNKKSRRTVRELTVELILGSDKTVAPCKILFVEEVFAIESPGQESTPITNEDSIKRKTEKEPDCTHCGDNPHRKCKECGCHVCGEKRAFDRTLLCDECNLPFHTFCLDPPLEELPSDDDWYCPLCRNDPNVIVTAGEKLKESKKKSKMKSATSETERDWGKGMACVGRSKICTIVPSNHCGPIPGVSVGTLWKYRVQVSEAGVHRPHVSGIHGKESDGAYSIVLSGGYEDDEDDGDEFTYTGSGGRDLSGNKRTAEQSCDQILTKNNMAIARSCYAKVDVKHGAQSNDWKKSRPIRVVRNYKGGKHSKYSPEEGNRYDGIYKVVKYWPEKGKSGFIVWRYLFRRDDKEPAPWTKQGKKKIKELGLTMQYPDGYLEAQKNANNDENEKQGKKRKRKSSIETDLTKKKKLAQYVMSADIQKLMKSDVENHKLWNEVKECTKEGQKVFLDKIQNLFSCVCCQDLVVQPVTTLCKHNMCKSCLQRSFKAEVYSCPMCRTELGKDYKLQVNSALQSILTRLFPGYENGR
ncbi:E3 ubiquitin-protein ligase UHRF1-like [Clavelina lepadiformis]|uniref:E3 ubiquitin-protein ligase UHRF1-like n=1 Tax=Clavelina lepadiformis TaxID=159417 RepID=UPI00404346DD